MLTNLTKERILEIKRITENLVSKSLSQIAKEKNISVIYWDLSNVSWWLSWAITKGWDWSYSIYINSLEPEKRQRFTLAHELWHFYLHKDKLDSDEVIADKKWQSYLYRLEEYNNLNDEQIQMEMEANEFAWSLLMPEEKFLELKWKFTIPQLSQIFNVSETAIWVRLYNLTEREYE